jgi:hypothetical protein
MKALLDEVLIRGKSSPRNNKLKPALREPRGIETLHYREVIELIKDEESPRWPEWECQYCPHQQFCNKDNRNIGNSSLKTKDQEGFNPWLNFRLSLRLVVCA